jgi:hypothetical protein
LNNGGKNKGTKKATGSFRQLFLSFFPHKAEILQYPG